MKWVWLLCIIIWICAEHVCANFTFTYNMAMQCKEHICKHGYFYETFYAVNDDERKIMKSDPSIAFEMHLAILAASNGHILLSPVANPDATVPVYEFVVGGGGNKFTELRGNLKRNARASKTTVGVVSPIEFRAFYIKISEDGLIEFGREGDDLPILSYQDMYPTEVHYFSFAAWNGVEAKFLYDCPIPLTNGSSVTPSSTGVEPQLSNSDKLKRTLLYNKNPYVPPRQKLPVDIGVKITSVYYNAFDSKLTTGIALVKKWVDDSMAWNPSKFNNVTFITLRQGEIWSPALSVFNSDSIEQLNSKNPELIILVSNGAAILHMQTTINTWCFDISNKMTKYRPNLYHFTARKYLISGKSISTVKTYLGTNQNKLYCMVLHIKYNAFTRWPRDEYDCTIVLEPWEIHEHILLRKVDSNDNFFNLMKIFTNIDEVIQNEWEMEATQYVLNSSSWNSLYSYNNTQQSDRFIININLKRRATAYNIVFYTPLLALVAFVLLSFWSEPLSMKRVWFYAYCTVIICMGMCYIDYLIPCHSVPTILVLYMVVLGGVLLALIIQVALMTSLAQRLCKRPAIQNILTAQWFRSLFCLPPLKVCQIYETIDECYDDASRVEAPPNGTIEEMQSDKTEHNETKELTEAIDKFMFIIYSVVFAVMLALHF